MAASPAAFECKLLRFVRIEPELPGETPSTVVFGRIIGVHIAEGFMDANERFDTARAQPVARLGYYDYAVVTEAFEIKRPKWPLRQP